MTKSKSTKKALFGSVVALFLCCTMLIGTTFAWFTDTATTGVNKIQSGTLDVDLVDSKGNSIVGQTLNFKKAAGHEKEAVLWEPGCTYELDDVYIVNNGNLALKYKIIVNGVVGDAKLLEAIEWTATIGTNDISLTDGLEWHLSAGEKSSPIKISGHMKEEAGNEYQNLTLEGVGITVLATQWTEEYDSYTNQYDKDAKFDGEIRTAEDFLAATAGGNLFLANDIDYNNTDANKQLIMEATSAINFNGNGGTINVTGADPSAGNHGYVGFVPPAGENVTVSNLTVSGTGFVELGHYGIGGGNYVANNLVLKGMTSTLANGDKGNTLACTFCHYGTATLNNCEMTGAKALISGATPVDAGFVNDTTTTINGGKYGVIYAWSKSKVTINKAEVDYIYAGAIEKNGYHLTIGSGTHVGTIDINCSDTYTPSLIIEDGATVDTIIYKAKSYTQAEWLAR